MPVSSSARSPRSAAKPAAEPAAAPRPSAAGSAKPTAAQLAASDAATRKAAAKKPAAKQPAAPQPEPEPQVRPLPVAAAAALTGLYAAVLITYGLLLVWQGVFDHPVSVGRAVWGGVIIVIIGAGFAAAAWGVARMRPWGRVPALFSQLMPLGAAYWLHQGGMQVWAALFLILGLGGTVLLFLPASNEVLNREVGPVR